MESQKRNLRARKPLADCTNTIVSLKSSASNFSAPIKPRKRVVKSAVKDVVNNEKKDESNLASESTSVHLQASNPSSDFPPPEPSSHFASPETSSHFPPPETSSHFPPPEPIPSSDSLPSEPSSSRLPTDASTPSSSRLPTDASTPSRRADFPSSSGTDRVSEPQSSFYSRRHPTNKRKSVEIAVAPFIFSTASKIQTRGEERDGYSSPSKARTVPYKKRQRSTIFGEDEYKIELPREFVEQQKAYFSEVDAFELPVEEAKSSDSE